MATDISKEYLKQIKFPHCMILHCLIWLRGFIVLFRSAQCLMTPYPMQKNKPVLYSSQELITPNLERESLHYQTQRWAFVDGMLDEAFHRELIAKWPPRKFFDPPKHMIKAYDIGFYWEDGKNQDPSHLEWHPVLKEFFKYLCSSSVCERILEFSGGSKELSCRSFLLTTTYPGSVVPPHKDGYVHDPKAKDMVNILFFIDGTGGSRSGGLTIIKDNTFTDVTFEPYKLRNTALIYDVLAPFFHGFRPIKWGKFRWAISVLFCPKDYVKKA